MRRLSFWLRWSWRDLRRRWVQVVTTSAVIAIGVAVFAGLAGLRAFREESAQQSFAALRFHDLRVSLAPGEHVDAGRLRRLVETSVPSGAAVVAASERLTVPTQLDGKPAGRSQLTPGLIVGLPLTGDDAEQVDLVRTISGRSLTSEDVAQPVAVIDHSYAKYYDLAIGRSIGVSGDQRLRLVGRGHSPQYFLITSDTGFGGESALGVLYTSLETAQRLAGQTGVNEIVVRFAPGTDLRRASAAVASAAERAFPGSEVALGTQEQAHTILFRDAKNDQRMMSFFGLLVLLGASIAAFNLVGRTVEAERREIGIGMALGLSPARLALRPLLLGAEIALLGTLAGAALSAWVAHAFAGIYEEFLPLPVYTDPFRLGAFLRGAAVGFLLPLAACAWPVWRGVSAQPVDAIRVSARAARGGLVRAATRLRLPGGTIAQMPWRNASRTPRRTGLAVVAIGAVLGSMVALLGIIDSFEHTIDRSRTAAVGDAPHRLLVGLTETRPEQSADVRALGAIKGVAAVDPMLQIPGELAAGAKSLSVVNVANARDGAVWRPALQEGRAARNAHEIVIAPAAARALGVSVGGRVILRAPGLDASGAQAIKQVPLRVTGLTADPFRVFAYPGDGVAASLGLAGRTNVASVVPAAGVDRVELQRRLAATPGVASAKRVEADSEALAATIDQFRGIISVAAALTLILSVLIAFNVAAIALEERRREYATMFAFGVPVRRALGLAATENLIVGVLGTALGIATGFVALAWMITALFAETWPEIGIERRVSAETLLLAAIAGALAIALTPYLLARRLRTMDTPSTLRVVE